MDQIRYPLASLLIVVTLGGTARAQEGRVAWAHTIAVDPDVPGSVLREVDEALGEELGKRFNVMPDVEFQARQGGSMSPDLKVVTELVATAQKQIIAFDGASALKTLAQAKAELSPKRLQLRDYKPVVDVLLYTATAALSAGKSKEAQESLLELARIRPDYQINAVSFPPNVIAAFEKARKADARTPRGRLEVKSEPEAAVFVDEVPRGQTPLAVVLSPGKHVLRLQANGYGGWTEEVVVAPYATLAKNVTLEWSRVVADLYRMKADVEAGALAPKMLEDGARLTAGLEVQAVLVAALGLGRDGFVVSVVLLPATGAGHIAVSGLDRRLKDLTGPLQLCAKTLATEPPSPDFKLTARVLEEERPTRELDFARYGLGLEPGMTLLTLGAQAAAANATSQGPAATPLAVELWPPSGGSALARWKNRVITADQLADRMKQTARRLGVQALTAAQGREAWEELLQNELLADEAVRQGALADPSFAPALKAALAKRLIDKAVDEGNEGKDFSEKELRDYYRTHRGEFFRPDGKDSKFELIRDAVRERLRALRRNHAVEKLVAGLKAQANLEIQSRDLEKALQVAPGTTPARP